MSDLVRIKETAIDKTLPPPGHLVDGQTGMLRYVDLDGQMRERDIGHLAKLDPMPLPMPIDREGYGTAKESFNYWASGHGDWLNVCTAMERHLGSVPCPPLPRLLDFGCATGRFLRHAWVFGKEQVDPWGCDFAPANVQWVKRHLPSEFKVVLNSSSAHLPFPDGYFDVVTGFSVFTHIDQFEEAWLLELRRITSKRGLLYLTIMNEASWGKVKDRPGTYDHLVNANNFEGNITINRELFARPMPRDRLVLRMSEADVYNCVVWHTDQYIRDTWSRFFEVLEIADNAHSQYQSPVILRPKS